MGERTRLIRREAVARAARERSEQEREGHRCDATGPRPFAGALRAEEATGKRSEPLELDAEESGGGADRMPGLGGFVHRGQGAGDV